MDIILTDHFKKNFKKRIERNTSLMLKYKNRVQSFLLNPHDPVLKAHLLKGKMKSYQSFSITGDVRVIYIYSNKTTILFLDIGTHAQMYGM